MKKKRRHIKITDWIMIFVIVAVFVAVIVMSSVSSMSTLTKKVEDNSILRLDTIRAEFQESLTADQNALNQFADDVEEMCRGGISDSELCAYIDEIKEEQAVRSNNVTFNCYVASPGFVYIPDFDMPANYHATERSWYQGAVDAKGTIYITEPYIDQMTQEICFTMSKVLSDGETVVSMDFTLGDIQKSIDKMVGQQEDYKALIVTGDGMIIGYSDMSYVGSYVDTSLPEFNYVVDRVIDEGTQEHFNELVGEDEVTVFSTKTNNGWYLILAANQRTLYWETSREIIVRALILVGMLILIITLYIFAALNRSKAEEALETKDEFLTNMSQELREPLKRIVKLSGSEHLENSVDIQESMDKIKESGLQLDGMLDNLFSYSAMVREENAVKHESDKVRKRDISRTVRVARIFIIVFLTLIMGVSIYLNIRQASKNAKLSMTIDTQSHSNDMIRWLSEQVTVLDMYVDSIKANPEILNDYDKCVAWMDGIAKEHEEISVCYMANPHAKIPIIMNNGWQPGAGWKVEERQWYKDTIRSEEDFSISAPYLDEQTGLYCVTLSEVVYGADGEFLGVFGIDFFIDKLIQILGESYETHTYAFLTDSSGRIINHPNKAYEMTVDRSVNVSDTVYEAIHESGKLMTLRDYNDRLVVVNRTTITGTGFYLYTVSNWLTIYASSLIWIAVSVAMFLACIIIVNVAINRIIRWQTEVNKQLQEAVEYATNAGKAKSQFLAQMSHEIRTPINAVIGMDEMILRETQDKQLREYATNIQSAGRTLLELINSILDFSKIEEGKMEIHPVKYETRQMADYLANMIEERAEKKGLTFIPEIDEELPESLFGDDVRLKQVIVNLLTNAVKYTHEGSVKLRMFGRFEDEENYQLTVSVEDTGIGIRKEDMDKLFISFERLEEEKNRNIEGTGLGISIVQGLLTRMGSHLEVESTYGKGSTFFFTVQQRIINSTPIGPYTREKLEEGVRKESFYVKDADILVVDDNDMNLKVAGGLLRLYHVEADTANSGKKALEMARKKRYDLIFLDHMMPGMDGIETFHRMQKEDLVYDTPVICLTANAIAGVREKYLSEGFTDYLSKPIEIRELEKLLGAYLPKEKLVETDDGWTAVDEADGTAQAAAAGTTGAGAGGQQGAGDAGSADGQGSAGGQQGAGDADAESGGTPLEILQKNGFDTKAGIEYSAGMENFYLDVVRAFADGYDEKAKDIREDHEAKNWEDYRTRVHALKSTAKMIGAMSLAEDALGQENAAKEVNLEALESGYQPLMEHYDRVVAIIRKALK
ncbi:MAG: response regulator [Eubacterium sp.]|nr:response regulator [Eubacterium sp.]